MSDDETLLDDAISGLGKCDDSDGEPVDVDPPTDEDDDDYVEENDAEDDDSVVHTEDDEDDNDDDDNDDDDEAPPPFEIRRGEDLPPDTKLYLWNAEKNDTAESTTSGALLKVYVEGENCHGVEKPTRKHLTFVAFRKEKHPRNNDTVALLVSWEEGGSVITAREVSPKVELECTKRFHIDAGKRFVLRAVVKKANDAKTDPANKKYADLVEIYGKAPSFSKGRESTIVVFSSLAKRAALAIEPKSSKKKQPPNPKSAAPPSATPGGGPGATPGVAPKSATPGAAPGATPGVEPKSATQGDAPGAAPKSATPGGATPGGATPGATAQKKRVATEVARPVKKVKKDEGEGESDMDVEPVSSRKIQISFSYTDIMQAQADLVKINAALSGK